METVPLEHLPIEHLKRTRNKPTLFKPLTELKTCSKHVRYPFVIFSKETYCTLETRRA